MYAAKENHSTLIISKWERRHARSFLTMPRTFISARQTFSTIKAQAASCQPQQTYSTLLIKKTQNPARRHAAVREPTSQAASSEAAMAGHCNNSRMSDMAPPVCQQRSSIVCRFIGARLPGVAPVQHGTWRHHTKTEACLGRLTSTFSAI